MLGAVVGGGVPGNAICCIAGMAGAGKQPSAAGRHPARSASEIVFRVWSSVALAAALYHGDAIEGDTVICIVSGGNADDEMIIRALQESSPHSEPSSAVFE